jgi:hypothetical protein
MMRNWSRAIIGGLTLLGYLVLATRERMRRDKAL